MRLKSFSLSLLSSFLLSPFVSMSASADAPLDGIPKVNPSGSTWFLNLESKRPTFAPDYARQASELTERLSQILTPSQLKSALNAVDGLLSSIPKIAPLSQEAITAIACEEIDTNGFGGTFAYFRDSCQLVSGKNVPLVFGTAFDKSDFDAGFAEVFNVYKNTVSVSSFVKTVYLELLLIALNQTGVNTEETVAKMSLGFSDSVWTQFFEIKFFGPLRVAQYKYDLQPFLYKAKSQYGDRTYAIDAESAKIVISTYPVIQGIDEVAKIVGKYSYALNFMFVRGETYSDIPRATQQYGQPSFLQKAIKVALSDLVQGGSDDAFWGELFASSNPNEIRSPFFWKSIIRVKN